MARRHRRAHEPGQVALLVGAGSRGDATASAGPIVALIATTSPSRGRARVSIDGKQVAIIDEYSPTIAYRQRVFTAHLPLGEHTLTVQVLGTHNPRSKGDRVDIDAFQVLVPGGSLASYAQPCGEPASPTSGLLAEIGL